MTFPIGLTAVSFDIVINDDEILENNETFIVSINSITNEHMVDTPGLTTITIVDTSSKILINTTNQLFYFILMRLIIIIIIPDNSNVFKKIHTSIMPQYCLNTFQMSSCLKIRIHFSMYICNFVYYSNQCML